MTNFAFPANPQLVFTPLVQLAALTVSARLVFKASTSPYSFFFVWLAAMGSACWLIFKHC
jgi:hypothetical protein